MNGSIRRARPLIIVALLALPGVANVAHAEEPKPSVSESGRTARAESAFREAVAAFASGRYHTAIELFTEADRTEPRPELSFDIARSYENLGNDEAAVSFYREYLRRAGHPSDEVEVRRRIDVLTARRTTPGPPEADDTSALISAQTPQGPFVGAGQERTASAAPDRGAKSSGPVLTTLGWIGLGAAGAAFCGALAFELLRQDAENSAEQERQQIRFDHYVRSMEADRTGARVLVGAGAALALTGGVLIVIGASQPVASERRPAIAVRASPNAFTADASWSF